MAALVYSIVDVASFLKATTSINDFILDKFGWLFSLGTLLMLLSCVVIFFHPISKQRIGGQHAKPILSKWRWFSIVICTTIATGIIFWGTAEPIYHLNAPPSFSGLEAGSSAAAEYSLSIMYLHWTFTPYAIYTIPAIMFALAFYNEKRSFSLKSTLYPFIPSGKVKWLGVGIDSICLYALVAGMSASLGAGILTLSGGMKNLFGFESDFLLLIVTVCIVSAFVLSAISGLMKGIRILSDINIRIFITLAIFVFIFGPTWTIISQAFNAGLSYLKHLPEFSLVSVLHPNDPWPKSWTSFNWANWLAWAPITALFLGRLSYGYTVKQFMVVNWILPSLFSMVWMSIFSGTVIDMQLNQGIDLNSLLINLGPESMVYRMFETLPVKGIVASLFLFTAFLSYVTAADSNTEAMGGISSTGISPDSPSPSKFIKVIWGVTIGAVAFVMISLAGVEGVKMLSNLGGLPSLFLIIAINLGLIKVLFFSKKI
ncbi:MAG: choline-glycine betaine transporter [Roseivirga sp.]